MIPNDKMCDFLENYFPEFITSKEYDAEEKEFPYAFFAAFGRLVTRWFENKDKKQIDKFFSFVNEFYKSAKIPSEQETLFAIEMFEIFLSSNYYNQFICNLEGKARETYIGMYGDRPKPHHERKFM